MKEIVDIFGVETATALELMTHNEAPWKDARRDISPDQPSKAIISKESMILFYSSLNEKDSSFVIWLDRHHKLYS